LDRYWYHGWIVKLDFPDFVYFGSFTCQCDPDTKDRMAFTRLTTQSRGDSMIFKNSWAADLSRSGTVCFRSGMVPICHINCHVWRVHVWQNYNKKTVFDVQLLIMPIWSYSVTPGIAKLLTSDFTTSDHPLLKPDSTRPAGVGGPRNAKSLNFPLKSNPQSILWPSALDSLPTPFYSSVYFLWGGQHILELDCMWPRTNDPGGLFTKI